MRPPRDSLLGYWLFRSAPVLPAWFVGLFVLLTSDAIWESTTGPNLAGPAESSTPAWLLLGTLVTGTALYACAPLLGRSLLTVVPASRSFPVPPGEGAVGNLGTSIVRVLTLAGLYVVVFGMACAA